MFGGNEKYFIGFDRGGRLAVTENEPFFGWEIMFAPKRERQKYLDGLFAHIYQAALPFLDDITKIAGDFRKLFGICAGSSLVRALTDYESAAAGTVLDFFDLEKFSAFLEGRIEIMNGRRRRFLARENALGGDDWRSLAIQFAHDMALSLKVTEILVLRMEGVSRKPSLRITSDRRKFSLDWEARWNVIYNLDRHPSDWYGPLQGCLNLDVQSWKEIIPVFRALAMEVTDKRAAPFEHLKISYPDELPLREDIEADIRILLDAYGMPNHPAMWTISRKKGNKYALHICLSLAKRPDDTGPAVMELDVRENATPVNRQNREGCREVAAARISERYGFPGDGLAWDAKGRRIAPGNFEKFNRWLS